MTMKKIILIFLAVILLTTPCFAGSVQDALRGVIAKKNIATPACAGIWEWTGDHASGEGYSCEGVDVSAQSGDIVDAAYGETGNGARKSNPNVYMEWANSGTANFNRAIGTVWLRIRVGAKTQNNTVFGLSSDSGKNILRVEIRSDNGYVRGIWTGNTDAENHSSAGSGAVSDATWTWVGYSWDVGNTIHCATVSGANTWHANDCSTTDTLTAMTIDPPDFGIGENDWGLDGATDVDDLDIDRVIIYDTYQANHP